MDASKPRNLGDLVHKYGSTAVGSFIEIGLSPFKGRFAQAMLFDAAHHNDPGHIKVGEFLYLFLIQRCLIPVKECLGCLTKYCSGIHSRVCCGQLSWL